MHKWGETKLDFNYKHVPICINCGMSKSYADYTKTGCKSPQAASEAVSAELALLGATERLNKIGSIVNDMLMWIERKDRQAMTINGVDYIETHSFRCTLRDINSELSK